MNPPTSPTVDPQVAAAKAYLATQGYTPPASTSGAPSWQSQVKLFGGGTGGAAPAAPTVGPFSGGAGDIQKPDATTQPFKNGLSTVDPTGGASKSVVTGLLPGVEGLGNEAAAAIGAPAATANSTDINNTQNTNIQLALQKIKELKALGIDTSSAEADITKMNSTDNGASASDVLPAVNDTPEQVLGNAADVATDIVGAGALPGAADAAAGGGIIKGAFAGAKVGAGFGAAQGAAGAMANNENAGGVIGSGVVGGVEGAAAGGVLGGAVSVLSGGASGVKNAIMDKFSANTPEEILATPESEVSKLSPAERKYYWDNQNSQLQDNFKTQQDIINQKASDTEAKVKADFQTKSDALQQKTDLLNRQVAVSSRDEVLALRPKIQVALGQQSQQYRALVNEELAPYANVKIDDNELSGFVDSKFSDDPAKAQAIKDNLGIVKTDTTPLPDGTVPTPKTRTLGDIYKQSTALGQDIGTGAKKGTRVFTPGEVMTDNSINTLTDFMKSKGVDLSEARSFWAKYAPIRNQLVTEAKPFLQAPTQTKTFANTITRVAKGTDVNNENFIAATEDLLGQKVGTNTREALSQLSATEKQQIAAEIDKQTQLSDAAAEEEQASQSLSKSKDAASQDLADRQFKSETSARRRAIVKTIIKKVVAVGIGGAVGNMFGGTVGEGVGGVIGASLPL